MFAGLIDNYTQQIIIFTGINVIAAYSFYLPYKTGQVSLGQAGFMAIGAYASAVFTQKFGFPFAEVVPVRRCLPASFAVVEFLSLRISGIVCCCCCSASARSCQAIAFPWDPVVGVSGLPCNTRSTCACSAKLKMVAVLIVFFGRAGRFRSSGRAMDSIHQDEAAAVVMGIVVCASC